MNRQMKRLLMTSSLMLALSSPAMALEITPTGDGQTLADAILTGGGITLKTVTYTGEAEASGTYTDGPQGIAPGAIVTSGSAVNALPPNDVEDKTTEWMGPGDDFCGSLAGIDPDTQLPYETHDAVRLEIVFELEEGYDGLSFDYIVGTEEYPEFVGQQFNDVVGVFLDGSNKALDGNNNPITINGPFFAGSAVVEDNGTQYDGATPRLHQSVSVPDPGEHTLVIVVCDTSDSGLDTGFFLAAVAGCQGDCDTVAWCGDGNTDDGEDCDDGNNVDGDGCDNTCKLEAFCGDGACNGDETCETCSEDCGECPIEPICGDGECNGDETCEDCPEDCGECPVEPTCGDGECNGEETCEDCPEDCGDCPEEGLEEGYYVAGNGLCSASPRGANLLPSLLLFALAVLGLVAVRRRPFRRGGLLAVIALVALAGTLVPGAASAQQIETQAFRPSPFMQDYLSVGVGDCEGTCAPWNIGLMFNYQNDPLVLHKANGDVASRIVEHQLTANLLAAYRFVDWFALGIDVPVVLFQDGEGLAGMPDPGVAGIGDIRLVPRFRILRVADGLFSLGAELGIYFPTGKLVDNYMGRNGFGFMPKLLGSFDFGRGGLALNLGFMVVTDDDTFANVELGHAMDARLGGWVGLVPDKLDLVAELAMQMKLLEPFENVEENPMEALLGLKWHATPGIDVSVAGGAGLTEGAAAPEFRLLAGLMYSPPCKEKTPMPAPEPVPEPKPEPKPEPVRDPDPDRDGLCAKWVADEGLADKYKEICVPTDKCPEEPETKNSYQDDDGCPDKAVVVEDEKIIILQKVLFYFDEARIKEESFPLLDEVVSTLKENPQLKKIRIEGHTDARGSAAYNKKLSGSRVATVLEYLVDHGIARDRLSSQGFGESKLLVPNAQTEEEHQTNRRVEFIILEQD